jgi:hypothetical protein
LSKLAQETHLPWPKLLLLALIRLRNTPSHLRHSRNGRPFLLNDLLLDTKTANLVYHTTQLAKFQQILSELGRDEPREDSSPLFCPGDTVLVKLPHASCGPFESLWEGPCLVLLSTPTGIKVAGLDSWIHISQAKCWTPEIDERTPKPHSASLTYSCEPVEDLKYLFKRTTSDT